MRSIRKALAKILEDEAEHAKIVTGRSINDLPEYYLLVKSAEFLYEHFKVFTFSMEDSIKSLKTEIQIDETQDSIPRGSGNIDLVIRGKKSKKVKHLVEFKRGFNKAGHLADMRRQAAFCLSSPRGHKTEKNFMVLVAPVTKIQMKKRHEEFVELIGEEFGEHIKVLVEYVDLSAHKSTRKTKRLDHTLFGAVWELKYSG
jgi:hypothetical protein